MDAAVKAVADKYVREDGSPGANRLPVLAREINAAIREEKAQERKADDYANKSEAARKSAMEWRLKIGADLIEAKSLVRHGEWMSWLRDNCAMSKRTSQLYMRIAGHKEEIDAKSATEERGVAHLSLRAASASIARPRTEPEAPAIKPVDYVTLDAWRTMTADERASALSKEGDKAFNKQETAAIEWAQWSWNPVTGCKHDCPYCYARDIANRFYPMGFKPALRPDRLTAPRNAKVPDAAASDIAHKNVFVCSMADLFGRWVPTEWIEAVLREVRAAPQWNFLFLTKFPKRYREFEFPDNAWIGTTVDCAARVKAAETAFEDVSGGKKWLSVEPMIDHFTFNRLDLFDWIVLGGASASSRTPEWRPPIGWWAPIYMEARDAGLHIFIKDNLFERERGFPGKDDEKLSSPSVFHYLMAKTDCEIEAGEE